MKKIMLLLILGAFVIGCSDNISEKDDKVPFDNIIHILLEDEEYGKSWLDVTEDRSKNAIVLQTRRGENILSISGFGNSSIKFKEPNRIAIDTVNFGNDLHQEYILSSFINGSTYGAIVDYIVYRNTEWEIYRVPFDRVKIRYDNEAGDYEIVSYLSNGDSILYGFNSGVLFPKTGDSYN